jgi:hypothetical protein
MSHLRKIEGKTEREEIRNQTVRLGLGIIPLREIIKLVKLGMVRTRCKNRGERYSLMSWQARIQGKRSKGNPNGLGK